MHSRIVLALVLFCAVSVLGHSYITTITTPTTTTVSRSNQKQTNSGCRGPACLGPCDISTPSSNPVTIARGAPLNIKWPRNNHAGGFIRFAWTSTSNSNNHANFDEGVQQINCHEVGGCGPDNSHDPNGGDSGTSDGTVRPCQSNIFVPTYLTDGAWTLQWSWFGGAFALGDYYSCSDFIVSGGSAVSPKQNAVFVGGDYGFPTQNVCKFFNTDRLHVCINEPCNTPIYPAQQQQSGVPYGFSNTSGSAATPTTQAVPTPTTRAFTSKAVTSRSITSNEVTSNAITSGSTTRLAPVTTRNSNAVTTRPQTTAPITSAAVTSAAITSAAITSAAVTSASVTSAAFTSAGLTTAARRITSKDLTTKVQPLTTKAAPITTRSRPLTTNAAPISQNCANLMTVIPSSVLTVEIINVDAWDSAFRVYFKLNVYQAVSDWAVNIKWPAGIVNPVVNEVADGAEYLCSSNSPNSHVVVDAASYNNELEPPLEIYFEVECTYSDADANYIASNTQFQIYQK